MNAKRVVCVVFSGILYLSICPFVQADFNLQVDPNIGFNQLQEPFSAFLNTATQVDINAGSTDTTKNQFVFPQKEDVKSAWRAANDWVKEKTGLDIWGLLKLLAGILIFVMNLALGIISGAVKGLQWVISIMPNTG